MKLKYLLILIMIFMAACSDQAKREREILKNLVNNSYTDSWKENKRNRANILKFDISPEEYLWEACNTNNCLALIFHLETLELLGNYSDDKWTQHADSYRTQALSDLNSESLPLRFQALEKLMIFGKVEDVAEVALLLKDKSLKIRTQAKGTLLQLGAPYRLELVKDDALDEESIQKYVDFYLNWYKDNKNKNREELLWNYLQKPAAEQYRQTIVNGLIARLSAKPSRGTFGSDTLWKIIKSEMSSKVRNQQIVLLGVLKDPKYIKPLLETGWLSNGSFGTRERVAWALNQMGMENPQPTSD